MWLGEARHGQVKWASVYGYEEESVGIFQGLLWAIEDGDRFLGPQLRVHVDLIMSNVGRGDHLDLGEKGEEQRQQVHDIAVQQNGGSKERAWEMVALGAA